jgi:hypothetical protein
MKSKLFTAASVAACVIAYSSGVSASPLTGSMSITYFDVAHGTGGSDFGGSGTPNVAANSQLGPDGLPVVSSTSPGIVDVNSHHEITWWTPSSFVTQTGTGTITLPYGSNMFAPNSTGSNDSSLFETAILTGTFTESTAASVTFSVGSDDDAFIYLNGVLIGQNPGIHGVSTVNFTATANSGVNTLEIFYADRETVAAELDISANVVLSAVPEPSTWAMMILGFCGLGFMAYRRKQNGSALSVA